jgi:hypothetical protein
MQIRQRKPEYQIALLMVSILTFTSSLPSAAQPLEVGIEHIEVLPSVSEELKKGKRFSLSLLADGYQANDWVRLPHWLCGTWRIGQETAVFRRDFKKNKTITSPFQFNAKHTFQYGMQKDRLGGIWHYIGTPYSSKTRLSAFDEYHIVNTKKFGRVDDSMVSFTTLMTVVRVRSGERIGDVYQQESITSYRPAGQDGAYIDMSASAKSFDSLGLPWRQSDNVARIKRLEPFMEVKEYQGKDMRKLFRDYLHFKGFINLVPD